MPIRPKAVTRLFQKLTGNAGETEERATFSVVLLEATASELSEEMVQSAACLAYPEVVEQHGEGAVIALQSDLVIVVRAGEDMMQVVQSGEENHANGPGFQAPALDYQAWLSIDYLSGRKRVERNRVYIYRRLAALAAELMDRDTLAVYFVHEGTLIPASDRIKEKLEYFESLEDLFS